MARDDSVPGEFFAFLGLLGLVGLGVALRTFGKAGPGTQLKQGGTAFQTAFTEDDVEALARMMASENPRGSRRLHVEQAWTEIRSRERGESLFHRITAGSGWGQQGDRNKGMRKDRPVSTDQPATDQFRNLAREILSGLYESELPDAKQFFDPEQQDKAFLVGERARSKQARGEALTKQEKRLIYYKSNAADIRKRWEKKGYRYVGTIDKIEFWTA